MSMGSILEVLRKHVLSKTAVRNRHLFANQNEVNNITLCHVAVFTIHQLRYETVEFEITWEYYLMLSLTCQVDIMAADPPSSFAVKAFSRNSLRLSDAIWWHRSMSTLAQVMAWCLTAPSHYLNQCWLIISGVKWRSSEGNFIWSAAKSNSWSEFEIALVKIFSYRPETNKLIS